ncbi:MAG: hypothetical protein IT246_02360 [Bacteroidia bacterium]|nr:hypothetical protein [Bacteroidia bacterium]
MKYLSITLGLFFLGIFSVNAQSESKRKLSKLELKQLISYSDSIQLELKKIYKIEKKENIPAKYQPQRIQLVKDYLWLFQYIESQFNIVVFTEHDIIKIIGKPNKHAIENGEHKFFYTEINRPYLRLKNFNYTLSFKSKQLVSMKYLNEW